MDNDDRLSKTQSGWEKTYRGLGKFIYKSTLYGIGGVGQSIYGLKELVTKGLSFLLLVYDLPNIDLSTLKLYITDFSGKHRVYKLMVKDDVASEFIEISKSSH